MKRLIAVVLIVSMIFTTGGFATLADSVDFVIETTKNESVETTTSHKYYDEPTSTDYTEEPEEPEVDETTVLSDADAEQNFDGEETTTIEVTTEELNSETTTNTSEEPTSTTAISEETATNASEEQTSSTIISEETTTDVSEEPTSATLVPTTEPTTVVLSENTNTESTSTATESVATEENLDLENQTENENNISTSSDAVENTITNSTLTDIELNKEVATNSETLEILLASDSEINNINLQNIEVASLSEISSASLSEINAINNNQLFGDGALPSNIWFGTFPQNDTTGVQYEPIRWRVLSQDGNEALLLSEKLLDARVFSTYDAWPTSSIRNWLRGDFMNTAFTENQKNNGIKSKNITTPLCGEAIETIFLLSLDEFYNYIPVTTNASVWAVTPRRGQATPYAKAQTGGSLHVNTHSGCSFWWLREPISGAGGAPWSAYYTYDSNDNPIYTGNRDTEEKPADYDPNVQYGIRPAMYVNLEQEMFKYANNHVSLDLDGGSWKSGSTLWESFDYYQGGQKLPDVNNLNIRSGSQFIGWSYSDDLNTFVTEIASDKTGDITLKARYKYNLTWDLEDGDTGVYGQWKDGIVASSSYIFRNTYVLPTNVVPPTGKFFDHWEIDGNVVTSLTSNDDGDKNIKAVYGTLPSDIWFGTYPQNDGTGVQLEPIKWKVLNQNGNEAFLVADKVIDHKGFNDSDTAVSWENSYIRNWLNNTFINSAFTSNQINSAIVNKTLSTTAISGNVETQDKVFLLSKPEVDNYFPSPLEKDGKMTTYVDWSTWNGSAIDKYMAVHATWWLRSQEMTTDANKADVIKASFVPSLEGREEYLGAGVRPAIYVDLSSMAIRATRNEVTWHLNGGSFKNKSTLWNDYNRYHGGQKLPTVDNLNVPDDSEFLGWTYESNSADIITEIAIDKKDNITLEAKYRYNITWDLHDGNGGPEGHFDSGAGPVNYINGIGTDDFPTNVVSQDSSRLFDHWEIDGIKVTKITESDLGPKTVKAVYKDVFPDHVWFGTYPQQDETGTQLEPIKWRVLDTNSSEIFLIADKVLDNVSYHHEKTFINWDGSDIRTWLNDTFMNTAFTANEINGLLNKNIRTESYENTNNYIDTEDRVFLLSVKEGRDYFSSNDEGVGIPSNYAKNVSNNGTRMTVLSNGAVNWFLRNTDIIGGASYSLVYGVTPSGSVAAAPFHYPNNKTNGIRPAMVLKVPSPTYRKDNNQISFNLNGGAWQAKSTLWGQMDLYQGGMKLPTADNIVTPTGKYFVGWSYAGETATVSEIAVNVTGDIELVANYKGLTYPLTFDMGEGHLLSTPSEYEYGIGLILPASTDVVAPVGHEFDHWEIENVATTSITTIDTGDKTIKAIYKNASYTINWELDGEHFRDGYVASTSYTYGEGLPALPDANDLVLRVERQFSHWIIRQVGLPDINPAISISPTSVGEVEIIAVYNNANFNVIWHNVDGSDITFATGFTATMSYTYSEGMALPSSENIVPPATKQFDYWIIRQAGHDDIEHATSISNTSSGDVEVIAAYKYVTYTVNYNANGGTITGSTLFMKTYNTAYVDELTTPTKAGYTFDGWYIDNDTFNTPYDKSTDGIYVEGTLTYSIYAKWNIITYTITYHENHGTWSETYTVPAEYNVTNASTITLPTSANIARNHYAFDGWYQHSDFSGSPVTSLVGLTENLVLYAKWNIVDAHHTITFLSGGGTGSMSSQYALVGEDTILDAVTFTRDGYTFNNWSSDDGRTFTDGQNIGEVTTDLTLTANWTQNPAPYYPSYNPGGGGGSSGGSGGGGGGSGTGPISNSQTAPAVTYINKTKELKAGVYANQVTWVYDPITNKFKMNINLGGQTIPASDGFYLVSNTIEQNANGILNTATYYFDREGNMVTGWVKTVDDKWCYLENVKTAREGMMVFGWYQVQSKWYYFTADGIMLANNITPDGYIVGADGAWVQ